jgi:hypothetical protein
MFAVKKGAARAAPSVKGLMHFLLFYFPVPDSGTTCGEFVALEVMVRLPVRVPFAVGVKVTLT